MNIGQIVSGIKHPRNLIGFIRWGGTKFNKLFHSKPPKNAANNILGSDWDNLVILDACRYDLFTQANLGLEGRLSQRISPASSSKEFIERNFVGQTAHDCIYITGNPYASILDGTEFNKIIPAYDVAWDSERGTVLPDDITELTKSAHESNPNKRLIIHYMQPHYPFLSSSVPTGRIKNDGFQFASTIWQQKRYNLTSYTDDEVWRMYRENLEIVLESVWDLLDTVGGKSVITADHGNLVGDRIFPFPTKEYGHPAEYFVRKLTEVPWYVIPGDRRDVIEDTPLSDLTHNGDVSEKLSALGYR